MNTIAPEPPTLDTVTVTLTVAELRSLVEAALYVWRYAKPVDTVPSWVAFGQGIDTLSNALKKLEGVS